MIDEQVEIRVELVRVIDAPIAIPGHKIATVV